MSPTVLLADIGGTTTRVARAGMDGVPFDVRLEANDSYGSLEDLLQTYLGSISGEAPRYAALAVAGPIDADEVRLTNRHWRFSIEALARELNFQRLEVLNDFEAFAHGLPLLTRDDLLEVGTGRAVPGAPMLLCGPGTGLGTAFILPREEGYEVIPSEAGHMRLGAVTTDEARIVAHLVRDLGPVSVEHVLSGSGLVRLHRILSGEQLSSHAIIKAALDGQRQEKESCHVFLRLLGRVLGDLALAFEAKGGVFVGGGVGRAMAHLFAESPFRAAFEEHPPYTDRLALVPIHVVTHATPGLVGIGEIGRRLLVDQ
ncbi:ROK family protein [Xanthobacter dioxanivorans]|uniref:ROK family protein n=1 Tax=Xanthobacter dioxanivorans TaxID=2528964 RepID=A0A974PRB8_9HYPH|nr:glucokinase [Xanthobacter dioxanivorans]QRG08309.1 ROK family protein [Xanthobacter dioxanivorans]